jgi:hypothetical protein
MPWYKNNPQGGQTALSPAHALLRNTLLKLGNGGPRKKTPNPPLYDDPKIFKASIYKQRPVV